MTTKVAVCSYEPSITSTREFHHRCSSLQLSFSFPIVYCTETAGTIKRRREASTIILSDDQMGQVRMAKNASDREEAGVTRGR
jgi:hypothetical protein